MTKTRVLNFQFPDRGRGEKKSGDPDSHKWNETLIAESDSHLSRNSDVLNIEKFVSLATFNEAALRAPLVKMTKGYIIEVELADRGIRPDVVEAGITTLWIAEIQYMAGYYLFARWLGAPKNEGFWVHAANKIVHSVGYTESSNRNENVLCPPAHLLDTKPFSEWPEYVLNKVHQRFTLPLNYDALKSEIAANKYSVGDRVELVHDEESTAVIPAVVKEVKGRRMRLEISKHDVDKEDYFHKDNLWKDQDDDLMYYVGFAAEQGYGLKANKKYKAHTDEIAKALKEGRTPKYMPQDVTLDKLAEWTINDSKHAEWEPHMALEIMDRIDTTLNGLKPARVLRVMKNGYLQVGPEGSDIEEDSFAIHCSSPMLFPVGYAEKYGIELLMPKNDEKFEWEGFLKRTGFKKAFEHLFHTVEPEKILFKPGQKMEAVDQLEKLLCPVTVAAVKGRMLHIHFDGWEDSYDQLYDYRSNDLLPIGWTEMEGLKLQPPMQALQESDEGEPVSKKPKK